TRQVLEEWVKELTPESGAALELLDPVLAKSGDHAMRISLREARMTTGKSEERGRLGSEVRAIYERDLAQPQAAFLSAVKDFSAGIDRAGLQPELERLAKETGLYEELAEIYETAVDEQMPGSEDLIPLVRRAAEVREQLGQNDEAIRLWKDLLVEAPQDRQALDCLSRLYETTKNAKNLAEIYARKAQLAQTPAEKLEALLKAGAAQEDAGEDADAIESFRSALALKKNATALEALDRLFGKERRTREQADVLTQLAELTTEPEALKGILLRRGHLLEKEGQLPEAADAFAKVLEAMPQEPNAIAGLERLLASDSTRATAARLLESVYRSVNDIKRLVEVLDLRLAAAPPGRRLEIVNEIANLREATGQKALAFTARLRAFAEAPELPQTRDEAERLAVDTGSYEELAAAFEEQLERGQIAEATQNDLWRRIALVYQDRLSRPDLAARAWEEVSRREPKDRDVLDALARIYRAGNLYKELAHVMRRQIALDPLLEQQVHLLYDLGHLAEESLGDRVLASQCYGEILRRVPEDANAVRSLGKVLAESERWPELSQLIAREIQLAHQREQFEEMFELMVRLGRLRLVRLQDPRGALQIFQEILKHRPGHPGAVGALEEMARSDSPLRGEAASALEPVFETGGDHLKLVQMLESRVSAETVPQERTGLLRRIAELYAGPMDNAALAFVAATKALRELPDDLESLKLCLRLVDKAEAGEELTAMLQEVVGKAVEVESRAVLHRTLAQRLEADGD
ncbi:MAG TPA: gliding motility protein, partial [Myxococcaceae bacterium]|nr:gliding motility protein [Myxococcaceae bacterium]